ncbi:hypothetical protein [Candidatus Portiera aleyrodidarum]|uniref:hypothetical protein n=1 Tax=Candidatus Portiera aleyrodidarum TaxID=91844 RepID=UPI000B16D9A1|nr:hypothetical protein [Candidatus Portiera aleyrodidarum]
MKKFLLILNIIYFINIITFIIYFNVNCSNSIFFYKILTKLINFLLLIYFLISLTLSCF